MLKSNSVKALFHAAILLLAVTPLAALAADHATVTASNMPTCMTPGQTKTVSVSVTNDGDTTWNPSPASPPPGCTRADNCPVRLAYHWAGPMNVANGLRTNLTGTVGPYGSLPLSAQLTAADTVAAVNLPLGTYTVKWQMVHEGIAWFPNESPPYTVEVKDDCSSTSQGPQVSVADLCKKVNCIAGSVFSPKISMSSDWYAQTMQGQNIWFNGKNLGGDGAVLLLKGNFSRKPGAKFQILSPMTIELPVRRQSVPNKFEAGPVPDDLVGYDQDVTIQVRTKAGALSNELKIRFFTKLDIKLLPRSAMKATCDAPQNAKVENCCNGISTYAMPNTACSWYYTNTVSGFHAGMNIVSPVRGVDLWKGKLNKGWKYQYMEGGTYYGSFVVDPQYSVRKTSDDSFEFKVEWEIPLTAMYDEVDGYWSKAYRNYGMGYWINAYVIGPMGMEP